MNFYSYMLIKEYEQLEDGAPELPDGDKPNEFWLSVLYYQKLFNSGYKSSMGSVENFSHLSVHAEEELDEMVLKWDPEHLFWMFGEIGYFTPDATEFVPDNDHEYVVQRASQPRFSNYEVLDLATNTVVWGANSTEECYSWIEYKLCPDCDKWIGLDIHDECEVASETSAAH